MTADPVARLCSPRLLARLAAHAADPDGHRADPGAQSGPDAGDAARARRRRLPSATTRSPRSVERAFDLPAILQLSVGPRWASLPPGRSSRRCWTRSASSPLPPTSRTSTTTPSASRCCPIAAAAGADQVVATRIVPVAGRADPDRLRDAPDGAGGWRAVDVLLNGIHQPGRGVRSDCRASLGVRRRGAADRQPAAARSRTLSGGTMSRWNRSCVRLLALALRRDLRRCCRPAIGWAALAPLPAPRPTSPPAAPAVTVLKPLHGDEPLLEEALASVCAQDYPDFQVVFGVQDPADPALDVVRRLQARFPRVRHGAWWSTPTQHGSNRKIGNLINMLPARPARRAGDRRQRHACAAGLSASGSPRRWRSPGSAWSPRSMPGCRPSGSWRAGADADQPHLPARRPARARRWAGRTASARRWRCRATRWSGSAACQALANHLADDSVLGRLVREQGLQVALADTVPATTVPETTLTALFAARAALGAHHPLARALASRLARAIPAVLGGLVVGFCGRRGVGAGCCSPLAWCAARA